MGRQKEVKCLGNKDHIPSQEKERLAYTLSIVQDELASVRLATQERQKEMDQLRKDLQTDREMANLWSSEEFEDLADLSQSVRLLTLQEENQDTALARRIALEYQQRTPYFARLRLEFESDEEPEEIYIGRFSLWDPKTKDLAIHDWRSPIASVFYRFGVENAWYKAPAGRIDCRVLGKRQYEIKHGEIQYCFDADTVIQDSVLRKMLSQNATPQMKSIVETIQKDQDIAIRDEEHDLLMIQGAAGSGKTSIALHRVAYLMYEGLSHRLRSNNILILSPNTIFEKYIASVLPELGQRNTAADTLEHLLEGLLHMRVQRRAQRLDGICDADSQTADFMRSMLAFKSSAAFVTILDRFIRDIPRHYAPYQDIWYGQHLIATGREMKNRMTRREKRFPLGVRLQRLERELWERIDTYRQDRLNSLYFRALQRSHGPEWGRAYSLYETASLARQIHSMTRLSPKALYLDLCRDAGRFRRLAKGLVLPDDLNQMLCATCSALEGDEPLPLSDATAIAYLHVRLNGRPTGGDIRHVVVDEAQDYGMVDYALLKCLYPGARFTVLGDIHQCMERFVDDQFYEQVSCQLAMKNTALMTLAKSFRCTREILRCSCAFLNDVHIQPFNRSGAQPRAIPLSRLTQAINSLLKKGHKSIALLTKTQREAQKWQDKLKDQWQVKRLGADAHPGRLFLAPLSLTKGLEFDAVIVLDCDENHYSGQAGRRLLYVASTRALHDLVFVYQGAPSCLLPMEVMQNE